MRQARRMPSLPTAPVQRLQRCQSIDLTAREQEVLALMANGYTNKQIAAELHVTVDTVRNHTIHVYERLGAANRTQAAALAVSRGLVVPDGEGSP